MKTLQVALLAGVLAGVASPVFAGDKPVNLSLFTPISIAKESDSVSAFRFNLIYGKNTSVKVLDLGLVNHTTSGLSKGLEWGFVNYGEADFKGVQLGGVNLQKGSFNGFEWGFVNSAGSADGLMLGFINVAEKLHGLQIGLVNVIKEGGQFPVFPIVNWSF
ncbi:MAG TPA: hypothetical protein VFH33_05580 [Candidatus Krumholzibacteria bacterium]|nr:hypothetical protein [Candidatus Krumholzibacteria bacterium]